MGPWWDDEKAGSWTARAPLAVAVSGRPIASGAACTSDPALQRDLQMMQRAQQPVKRHHRLERGLAEAPVMWWRSISWAAATHDATPSTAMATHLRAARQRESWASEWARVGVRGAGLGLGEGGDVIFYFL